MKQVEVELLRNIKIVGLKGKNRIFHDERSRRGLLSMSLSQRYELLTIAENSFANITSIMGCLSEIVGILWNRERNYQNRRIPQGYIS